MLVLVAEPLVKLLAAAVGAGLRRALNPAVLAALLHGVGQLMGQQAAARDRIRRELAGVEDDIRARGVGPGVQGARQFRRPIVRMHPYHAEVMAEAQLHKSARLRVEELTW